jgi:hypothetical protein
MRNLSIEFVETRRPAKALHAESENGYAGDVA